MWFPGAWNPHIPCPWFQLLNCEDLPLRFVLSDSKPTYGFVGWIKEFEDILSGFGNSMGSFPLVFHNLQTIIS